MRTIAAWIFAACCVAAATAQNADRPDLSGILNLFSAVGNRGAAGGALNGGLGSGLLGNSQLTELLKPVLENIGIDTAEVQAGIQKDDRRQRLRDNINQEKAICSEPGYSKTQFTKTCTQGNFTKFVLDDIPYGEPTFDVMFEGSSAKYEHIRQNLYMCAARRTIKYYTTRELRLYLNTDAFRPASRLRGKDKCLQRLNHEKETCDQLLRLLCSFASGSPLECRVSYEMSRQDWINYPGKRYEAKVAQPLTSVRQVREANFNRSIAHGPECDRYSLELETADLIALDRAAKEEERRERLRAQNDGAVQASPTRRTDSDRYRSDRGPELAAELRDAIDDAPRSHPGRTRGNGRK